MRLGVQLFLISTILILYMGCNRHNNNLNVVAIDDMADKTTDLSLDKFGYGIAGIALETSDSILLNGKSQIVHVSDSDIFVLSNSLVYRFDKFGKFKKILGKIGNGPGEHSLIVNVSFRENMIWLYVGNRRLICWDIDGLDSTVTDLNAEGWITCAYRVANGFVAEERMYGKDGSFGVYIDRFDDNGLKTDSCLVYENKNSSDSYQFSPVTYTCNDEICYYNPFLDNIFNINESAISESFAIYMGKLTPDRNSLNDMEYREKFRDTFLEILDLKENDTDLFLLAVMDKKLYGGIYNKVDGIFCSFGEVGLPWMNGGIRISEGIDCYVWPQFSEKNVFYSFAYPGNLDTNSIEYLKEIKNNDITINEESNPFVIICLKKS